MVGPSSPKALQSLHIFSMKSPTNHSMSSMKFKTFVQTCIFSHLYKIARALAKAKSIIIELLKDIHFLHLLELPLKKNKNKNKLFFGSFRLHYNWCSSHVMPMPMMPQELQGYTATATNHLFEYYDSSWNSLIHKEVGDDSQLSSYLQWLEEKGQEEKSKSTTTDANEIDKLADMFIANCHEKFRLEKVESYRRFQEMMARSV
ncbi:hypothetical protein Leryth_016836 [Lithospermum erythrorhizon]|nr:hypothetical protein Leryth_016836 [Lithospermum erythrorhizon]